MNEDIISLISKLREYPNNQDLINDIGVHFLKNKNYDEAIKYFKRNLIININNYISHFNLGSAYENIKKINLAIDHYNKALKINNNFELAYFRLGNIYLSLGKLDLAIDFFTKSISMNSKNIISLINRGVSYHKSGNLNKALKDLNLALSLDSNNCLALINRGNIYKSLNETDKAEADYDKVLYNKPNYAEAYFNKGALFQEIGKFEMSIICYTKAINFNYKINLSKYNIAFIQLLTGDFSKGFKNYEYRWQIGKFLKVNRHIKISRPKSIEEIKNKKILVFCEQGFGDIFQFSRYLIELENICSEIIFEVPEKLFRILNNLKLNKTKIIKKDSEIIKTDFCIGLLSLPALFKTNINSIPTYIPYLKNNLSKDIEWKNKLGSKNVNIGICWRGSENLKGRSLDLLNFKKISQIKNVNLISLQKDLTNKERGLINNEINLIEFTDSLDSDGAFLDTASIITNCNLIISVDTSIAHLAGILNKQVWVLLKKFPDWRWLLNRKTTPWYPNVTLFRQENDNNWNKPIKDIYEHLLAKLEKK